MARLQFEVLEEAGMACYKVIATSPRVIAVNLQRQLVTGSFAHAVQYRTQLDLIG